MLIRKKVVKEADDSYIESIFDSTNILKTTYFPTQKRLYISFRRGETYSYGNVDESLYKKFEDSDSQGEFFIQEIKKKPNEFPYRKEFSLYSSEIQDIKKIISEHKNKEDHE